jgi:hypothetical protein
MGNHETRLNQHQEIKVFLLLFFQKKKHLLFLKKKKQKDFYFFAPLQRDWQAFHLARC